MQLVKYISLLESDMEIQEFLNDILTESEILEISKRLEIVIKLKSKQGQHAVAKELGVGVATVTRGAKVLRAGGFKKLNSPNWP